MALTSIPSYSILSNMSQPIRLKHHNHHHHQHHHHHNHDETNEASSTSATKNVVVLGGSYGGMHAATVLAQRLPPSHRVILIERNSHFNHLYVFPRFSVVPGHEHKAFIPYSSIFKDAPQRPKRHGGNPNKVGPKSGSKHSNQKYAMAAASRTSNQLPASRNALEMGSAASSSQPGPSSLNAKLAAPPTVADVPEGALATPSSEEEDGLAPGSPSISRGRLHDREARSRGTTRSRDSRNSSHTTSSSVETESSVDSDSIGASTMASSYTSNSPPKPQQINPSTVENQLPHAAEQARSEEKLGRPELQVTELAEAMADGLDLGEDAAADEADDSDAAEGFEESSPHVVLQATVTAISPTHITVAPADASSDVLGHLGKRKKSLWSIDSVQIPYTHLVYALGSHLPDPLRTEARTKTDGVSWMQEIQERVKRSNEIVLVGGGALGVEFATDIASLYPEKSVTLIHSRKQLLPNFDERVHTVAYARLKELGVNVVLGERLALTEGCPRGSTVQEQQQAAAAKPEICTVGDAKGEGAQAHAEGMCVGSGRKLVKTTGGRSFECDLLLLCTGQQPNSSLMAGLSPSSVDPSTRLIRVDRSLRVAVPDPRDAAQQPFDARPPCGDCDCFLDKKASSTSAEDVESHQPACISNVYAIGDCADAFGALNAGYQAWAMAEIAVENILRDIRAPEASVDDMITFTPAVNMLKLSLGLGQMVLQGAPVTEESLASLPEQSTDLIDGRIVGKPEISIKPDPEDLGVEGVWTFMANADTADMHV